MTPDPLNLIWIDLEMTGLDTSADVIIEIATIVTAPDLRVLGEGPVLAIRQPETVLERMNEWSSEQHAKSGLLDDVRASKISCAQAEVLTLDFLRQHAV